MTIPFRSARIKFSAFMCLITLYCLTIANSALATAPAVTSFAPTSGAVGAIATITGTNFTGATAVKFNTTAAITFTVVSSTSITATVPTGATTGKISVTTSGGTGTSSASFTVVAAPTITSFTPTSGAVGATVTITGTNFTGATAVKFNTTAAVTFTVVSSTSITATVPTGATTGKISVTAAGVTVVSSATFTVVAAPTITSFTPSSGLVGTSVTITGTNLASATAVKFNGTTATATSDTATTIIVPVPTGATTGTISVTTAGGTATSTSTFTVSSLSPPTGLTATGGSAQVSLSWTAGSGDVDYAVYRGTSSGGESTTAVATGLTSPSYTNTGLTNGTTYYFTVKSYVGSTYTVASNEASSIPLGSPGSLAETPSNNSVALTWTSNSSGASGYNIYRGLTSGGEGSTALGTSTSTSYTDSTAVNGTAYFYIVKATKSSSVGSASGEVSSEPLATVSSLAASPRAESVQLSWTLGSGDTSVNIYRGTSSGHESATALATGVTSPYTDSGLTDGSTYYYKVKSVNSTGTSAVYSSEVSAMPEPIPFAPTGVEAYQNIDGIWVQWDYADGPYITYNVYRSTTSGGEGATPFTNTGTNNDYYDTTLTPGVTYYYQITAVNASGESPKSLEVSAVAPTPPPAPSGLVVGTVTDTTAAFTYGSVSSATGYFVSCSLVSGGEADTYLGNGSTTTSVLVYSLAPSTRYYAVVQAEGADETISAFSNEVSFTTLISAPTNLTAAWEGSSIVLNWTASYGATTYTIQRQFGSGSITTLGTTSSTTYTDTSPGSEPPGTNYTYYVDATSSTNHDPAPASVSIQSPIAAPTGVTATGAYEAINLSWSAPPGGLYYMVRVSSTSGGPYSEVAFTGSNPFTDSGLADNTTYYYVIGSWYENGTPDGAENDSSEVSATTAPSDPSSLTATASAARAITLSWSASAGASTYNVYQSSTTGGPYTEVGSSGTTSYTATGLGDSTAYYFVVTAVNSEGAESQYSPEATTTTWIGPPTISALSGDGSVTISWNAVPGVLGYTVYRSNWDEFSFGNISGMTLVTGTSYVDSSVTDGVDYYYVVTDTTSLGESAYSNVADAFPSAGGGGSSTAVYQIDSGGPAVGSWVADEFTTCPSTYSTTNTIDLSHAVNPAPEAVYQTCDVCNLPFSYNITGLTANAAYIVRLHFADAWATLPGQREMSIGIQGVTVASNWDTIQAAGGPNIATVAQFNTTADSSGDIAILFTGITGYPIVNGVEIDGGSDVSSAPFGLYAIPGHAQVMLGWNGYAGLTGYNVYRGTTSGGPYTLITSSPVSGTTYTDSTASNGTTYYYVVTAVNAVGESARSNEAYATPESVNASVYRINCGGPDVGNWTGQTSSYTFSTTTAPILTGLSNPAPTSVYQTEDNGNHTLSYLTPGNNYVLRLHLDSYASGSNMDVLSVAANGTPVLTRFDIRSASGETGKAVIEQFNVTPDSSGNIAITLSGVLGNGGICGIELLTDSLPPSQPTHLVAWRGNTQVTLNWNSEYEAATYNLYRSTVSGGPYTQIASGLSATTYSDATVANDYYVVTAVSSSGESGYSNEAYPTTPFTLSANPASLSCSSGGYGLSHITASSSLGFSGTISYSGSTGPTGVTGLLYPASSVLGNAGEPDIAITTGTSLQLCVSGTTAGTYPITITGACGDYSASTTVNLTVH